MTGDRYMTKAMGGDVDAPASTSGTSIQYPTGPIDMDETAVDEIDLGAGAGVAGTPGAGLHRQLWLWVQGTGCTGTGSLTLDVTVETDDNTSFSSAATRFTTPQLTMTQATSAGFYICTPLPYLPERYARIGLDPSGTSAVFTAVQCGITDNGDSRFVNWTTT